MDGEDNILFHTTYNNSLLWIRNRRISCYAQSRGKPRLCIYLEDQLVYSQWNLMFSQIKMLYQNCFFFLLLFIWFFFFSFQLAASSTATGSGNKCSSHGAILGGKIGKNVLSYVSHLSVNMHILCSNTCQYNFNS